MSVQFGIGLHPEVETCEKVVGRDKKKEDREKVQDLPSKATRLTCPCEKNKCGGAS